MRVRFISIIGSLFHLLALAGCGGGESLPTTVPVTGTVTYNGDPVEGASVVLISDEMSIKPARGETDSSGKFSIRTYFNPENDVEGAVPGKYSVLIIKKDNPDLSKYEDLPILERMELEDSGKIPKPKHLLPKKYANPTTTEFQDVSVADGEPNELKLELTD